MKLRLFSARVAFAVAVFGTMATAGSSAVAATLSLESVEMLTSTFFTTTPVDLTAEGTLDWAYWDETANPLSNPQAPTNRKQGGSLISSISASGGGGLRGSPSAVTIGRYNFSDGTSPASDTNHAMAGLIFNNSLGSQAVGKGISLQITGDPETEQYVRLYLGGYGATGQLTLSLNGAPIVLDDSQTFGPSGPKSIAVYTLRFQPDAVTDLLTVTFTALKPTTVETIDPNAHVGLEAVTGSAVPEPGSAVLLGMGAIALAGTRRRRR